MMGSVFPGRVKCQDKENACFLGWKSSIYKGFDKIGKLGNFSLRNLFFSIFTGFKKMLNSYTKEIFIGNTVKENSKEPGGFIQVKSNKMPGGICCYI